jgi:hypothetical protein
MLAIAPARRNIGKQATKKHAPVLLKQLWKINQFGGTQIQKKSASSALNYLLPGTLVLWSSHAAMSSAVHVSINGGVSMKMVSAWRSESVKTY